MEQKEEIITIFSLDYDNCTDILFPEYREEIPMYEHTHIELSKELSHQQLLAWMKKVEEGALMETDDMAKESPFKF